jgi:hypothetical protein
VVAQKKNKKPTWLIKTKENRAERKNNELLGSEK